MEDEYCYWKVEYVSCESNKRYVIVRTPIDWEEEDVRGRIPMGGCGDDVAEITEIYETYNDDYGWDFCE